MTLHNITHAAASAAILRVCDEGRLIQGQWHDRAEDGREFACLLGAIHPSVTRSAECNDDLMPMWLAVLTPVLFDGVTADQALPLARRYGVLVGRWHALSPAQWSRVLTRFLIRTIDEAVDAARPGCAVKPYWLAVDAACAQVKAALENGKDLDGAARAAVAAWVVAEARAEAAEAAAEARAEIYLSLFTFLLDQIDAELAA